MKITPTIACALVAVLTTWGSSGAADSPQPQAARFLKDYPTAQAKLASAASKVACYGRLVSNGDIVRDNEYFVDGDRRMVVSRYSDIRGQKTSREAVQCRTPEFFFQLGRPSADLPFIVNSVSRGTNVGDSAATVISLGVDRYMKAAYTIGDATVMSMIRHPSFKMSSVEERAASTGASRVEVRFTIADPSHWVGGGRMAFEPDLDWSLVDYDVEVATGRPGTQMPPGSRYKGSVESRRWDSGQVFPENGRFEFIYPGGRGEGADVFQLHNVKFGDVPESQFKLSVFGVSDAILTPHSSPRIDYWIFGGGLACLAALRHFAARSNTRRAAA
ncbi:hypothetical protein [Planctomyces sp. SH-PL62]|uniref:hypothetical protein n=1 Tax=Planctomyces sp. SH-PL62 TaxID=1636152 RepID=UPI00078EACE0|nr:hypothetical protein [Planctomyces sp. SH-PL62]AMV40949.1 hypothetical protein VT85_26175 [Planctomyces sp. SH-PL62]